MDWHSNKRIRRQSLRAGPEKLVKKAAEVAVLIGKNSLRKMIKILRHQRISLQSHPHLHLFLTNSASSWKSLQIFRKFEVKGDFLDLHGMYVNLSPRFLAIPIYMIFQDLKKQGAQGRSSFLLQAIEWNKTAKTCRQVTH